MPTSGSRTSDLPQIQVGLLVDPSGFALEVRCFEGNKAETTTLLPVLRGFQERHDVSDMVVVADAGMLSAAHLNALNLTVGQFYGRMTYHAFRRTTPPADERTIP